MRVSPAETWSALERLAAKEIETGRMLKQAQQDAERLVEELSRLEPTAARAGELNIKAEIEDGDALFLLQSLFESGAKVAAIKAGGQWRINAKRNGS